MSQRQDRTELELNRERCFLVAAIIPGRYSDYEEPLNELLELVDTAGGEVVGQITQKLNRPHRRTFLGKGKFAEIADLARAAKADTIVVDDQLSPSQISAIEDACCLKVIDRNEVILDIFATKARSHQAKLQVELALLQYELPRLTRKWTHLERLGGGMGTRGPGESQIETDRRLIRRKVSQLQGELKKIQQRKEQEVQARTKEFTVCLVGYTNAGKSSLMNQLSGAAAFTENRLFATLDTLTRKLDLDDNVTILLSDTVGFIRRLPHHLVASFHATLEEAAQADLLLHVVDGADPLANAYVQSVNNTLAKLGMSKKPRLHLINKEDLVENRERLGELQEILQPSLLVSAHTGTGCEELRTYLKEAASANRHQATLRFGASDGKRFALINQHGSVLDTRYEEADVIVTAILSPENLERIKSLPGAILVS